MVSNDALGNLYVASVEDIAGSRLEEEERLLRDGVVELLGMLAIVAANGHNLAVK